MEPKPIVEMLVMRWEYTWSIKGTMHTHIHTLSHTWGNLSTDICWMVWEKTDDPGENLDMHEKTMKNSESKMISGSQDRTVTCCTTVS